MLYHLGKFVLVLALVLMVPTVLILASQNAIPGDSTYLIKRKLEDGIIVVASLHPSTRAMFHVGFSQRRFKEAVAVIKKGGKGYESLDELVSQTRTAATSVKNLSDKEAKKQLAADLSKQIEEYDKIIAQLGRNKAAVRNQVVVKASPTAIPTATPIPPLGLSPVPTVGQTASVPTPTPVIIVIQPPEDTNDYQSYLEELERLKREMDELRRAQEAADQKNSNLGSQAMVVAATSTPKPPTSTLTPRPTATSTPVPPTPTTFRSFQPAQQQSGGGGGGLMLLNTGPEGTSTESGTATGSAESTASGDLLNLEDSVKGISTVFTNTSSTFFQVIKSLFNFDFLR